MNYLKEQTSCQTSHVPKTKQKTYCGESESRELPLNQDSERVVKGQQEN